MLASQKPIPLPTKEKTVNAELNDLELEVVAGGLSKPASGASSDPSPYFNSPFHPTPQPTPKPKRTRVPKPVQVNNRKTIGFSS
jgi:hypothetical protein